MASSVISYFEVVFFSLAILLPIAHPSTGMALMMGLSASLDDAFRRGIATSAAFYSFIIMVVTWGIGAIIMDGVGVGLNVLRISGGTLLIIAGMGMLFPTSSSKKEEVRKENIAFMPIALPGTAGPGVISLLIGLDSTLIESGYEISMVINAAIVSVFIIICVLLWIGLFFVDHITSFLGSAKISVITCLIGFIQFCIGTQFVVSGIKGEFFM